MLTIWLTCTHIQGVAKSPYLLAALMADAQGNFPQEEPQAVEVAIHLYIRLLALQS